MKHRALCQIIRAPEKRYLKIKIPLMLATVPLLLVPTPSYLLNHGRPTATEFGDKRTVRAKWRKSEKIDNVLLPFPTVDLRNSCVRTELERWQMP